jgi:glycosyltransferase involved in cell wall biosynthesis
LIRRVAVVIPAANEERRIGRCLAAVAAARRHLHSCKPDVTIRTVVVLDGCQDRTAVIAAASRDVQTVAIAAGSAGAARRAGVSAALTGSGRTAELWLANTDADSQVPVNWLTEMVTEASRGADLVLGTVLPGLALRPEVRTQWLSRHHLRAGHPHVHGANFGIRADAYLALGGWPPSRTGEDTELARRAARAGHLRIARTASIPVITSVRQNGRAPRGFSGYLRDITAPAAEART